MPHSRLTSLPSARLSRPASHSLALSLNLSAATLGRYTCLAAGAAVTVEVRGRPRAPTITSAHWATRR